MTGVILSGGENTRMPFLKGLLKLDGRTIIERSLEVLRRVFGKAVISTNMPEKYFYLGAPMVGDIRKERGPMTGILSALAATGDEAVFVVACDMPFVSEALICYMADKYNSELSARNALKSKIGMCDAVIPVYEGRPEPLIGIYTSNAIQVMESAITEGHRSLIEMIGNMNTFYMSEDEMKTVDPAARSFVNVNTVEDYERIGGVLCSA